MLELGTIHFFLPPITWTGFCLGTLLGTIGVLALGLYSSRKQSKQAEGIPFEQITDLNKKNLN